MADAKPGAPAPAKPKRASGPRVSKPKTVFLMFKGQLEGEPSVTFDNADALDKLMADRDIKVLKIVVPVKPRAPKAQAAAA